MAGGPFDNLVWACHVCGDERPDAAISVAHRRPAGPLGDFPGAQVNVRYCNDRPDCAATANEGGPWAWRRKRGIR
jgi:hypothetical protein